MYLGKYIQVITTCVFLMCSAWTTSSAQDIRLKGNVNIYTSAKPGEPLYKAVSSLQHDLEKVLGGKSTVRDITAISTPGIVIVNSAKDRVVPPLAGYEAHRIYVQPLGNQEQIVLQGADMRGTIYAVYTFSEKILGVPPLWYYCSWQPEKKKTILVPADLHIQYGSPEVKYRAWFPNDMDLFSPWRKLSKENNEMWLETALRLKMNTIQWVGGTDFSKPYTVAPTTQLISDYGMINNTHHHAPLYSNLGDWAAYWKKARHMTPPEFSLTDESKLEEFWRYNVSCITRNHIEMLWELGFRGDGDLPFWRTFKDAPATMKERADVINRMMKKQRDLLVTITGNPQVETTTIFYDELSDMLSAGYLHPPADSNFIWTFVAARRDHYPNKDMQQVDPRKDLDLGYYLNMQFTSTGSHLVEGEGPWKMEQNFRYVDSKSSKPVKFSVVNAGNIREFLLSLSANAQMMWNMKDYHTDQFLQDYCILYFGKDHAAEIATLYKNYFNAYWQQKKPDLPGFDRQYIFQDLRYKRAIEAICRKWGKKYDPDPLKDYSNEQEPGRTYRIVPADNGATDQVDAIINGTTASAGKFLQVAQACDQVYQQLAGGSKVFFNDNLRAPAYFMYYLNVSLLNLCKAYRLQTDDTGRRQLLDQAAGALKEAKNILQSNTHAPFKEWYAGDRIFGLNDLYQMLNNLRG